jgi:hypothetical protein
MSATINFHFEAGAAEPVVGRVPGMAEGRACLTLYDTDQYRGSDISIFGTNDQLAAIAKAILAHLERQEQGDFEQEVA